MKGVNIHWSLISMLVLALPSANAEPDVLQRPALRSSRAVHSAMLDITKAGKRIVAVGERGLVLFSDDDGSSWRQAQVPVSVSLTQVCFPTAVLGWAVGHGGVVLHSDDAGETWTKQLDGRQAAQIMLDGALAQGEAGERMVAEAQRLVAEGADKPFFDVHFFDDRRGIIVGAYGLALATYTGGESWRSIQVLMDNPDSKHLYSIHVTTSEVLIAGEQGLLLRSEPSLKYFSQIKTPYAGTYFGVLSPADGQMLVFGLRGNAFWSADGGHTWNKTDSGAPNNLAAGLKLANGSVALVDDAGRVLMSRDGGRTFEVLEAPTRSPLTGAVQASNGTLLLSGVRGIARIALSGT
jgi:photosystem II stability/assembly factor-like uncharacterized protein